MHNTRPLRHLAMCITFGSSLATGLAQASEELRLYNWGDYINPQVLTRFTADTGIKVSLDTYGSNEDQPFVAEAPQEAADGIGTHSALGSQGGARLECQGLLVSLDIGPQGAFGRAELAFEMRQLAVEHRDVLFHDKKI